MGDPSVAHSVYASPLTATFDSRDILRTTPSSLHANSRVRWRSFQKSSVKKVARAQRLPLQTGSLVACFQSKHPADRCLNRRTPSLNSPRRMNRHTAPLVGVRCSHSQLLDNVSTHLFSSTAFLTKAVDLLHSLSHTVPLSDIHLPTYSSSSLTQSLSVARQAFDSVWILGQQIATAGIQTLSQSGHLSNSEFVVHSSGHFLATLRGALEVFSETLSKPSASVIAGLISVAGSATAVSSLRSRSKFKDDEKASDNRELSKLIALRDQQLFEKDSLMKELVHEIDFLPTQYDPAAIADYFRKRPFLVLSRATHIIAECSSLIGNITLDFSTGKLKENESLRAAQLVAMITRLGPTAIKIGQALSARPDIIPATYLEALQNLQDRVPSFPNEEAKRLILKELGQTVDEIYSEFSAEPVAAASIGQVYRAKLRTSGEAVAVKVQRPNILQTISLDLHILRAIAKGLPNISSDLVPLLDYWADHIFHELDYMQEAGNATEFGESMKSLSNVMVPKVYMQHTSCKVLTMAWVEGQKLSDCGEEDLDKLVFTCLNCFLIQLLESGFLHADPHPGNLLRTRDGRLCVLDFGLMTQVTEDQRYALLDFISHMINADYEKVADDMIHLGFVPPDLVNPELTKAVLPQLRRVLSQLVQGGGFKGADVQQVMDDLAGMASDYSLVIPPYFALILRTFSILEGIGLKSNPNYSIVEECYPYISKRLLTDDSPRTRIALKYFLYGNKEQLDVQRVEVIFRGLQSFNKSMASTPDMEKAKLPVSTTSNQLLSSLFAPEGSFVQEMLLTELVRIADALSREALFKLWSALNISSFPFAHFLPSSCWPSAMQSFFFGVRSVMRISDEDEKALKVAGRLLELVSPQLNHQIIAEMTLAARSFPAVTPDLACGVTTASVRFLLMMLHRKALRMADDLDGKNSIMYWNRDPIAFARNIKPLAFTSTTKFRT